MSALVLGTVAAANERDVDVTVLSKHPDGTAPTLESR